MLNQDGGAYPEYLKDGAAAWSLAVDLLLEVRRLTSELYEWWGAIESRFSPSAILLLYSIINP